MSTETQTTIPTTAPAGSPPTTGGSGLVPYRLTVCQFEVLP
jgi:hypothetical protein